MLIQLFGIHLFLLLPFGVSVNLHYCDLRLADWASTINLLVQSFLVSNLKLLGDLFLFFFLLVLRLFHGYRIILDHDSTICDKFPVEDERMA